MKKIIVLSWLLTIGTLTATEISSIKSPIDLGKKEMIKAELFKDAESMKIDLMAQPMVAPRPATGKTEALEVKSIHNEKWIAFMLTWNDKEKSEAGKLGEYSDAVAIQFPVKKADAPPPVFMGSQEEPVHIFHWRAQYQLDAQRGRREMKDIYPNMNIDMYPMEFKDSGSVTGLTNENREEYSTGKAAGNPQAFSKTGLDEIIAEGFSTSSVISATDSYAFGKWENGKWNVYIVRPKKIQGGSDLLEGNGKSFMAFAVWQGGEDEVGSRKAVTMMWTPIVIK